ncbi:MAG: hydrogen peroxide-inducible genes activator [Gammaproteobacteria bacterium]|nr:hydrogen peroxide-inducible genes activator [Gammaproteobacteria bacterium]
MISLKQLSYALAVDRERHFRKAAEACSVSQSALSTAVAELENQLGIQIFERDNKKVLVTPIGEQILQKAQVIGAEVSDLYQMARLQKTPLSYPMSLGVIPTIGPYLLPKVLPEVRRQYPDFELTIIEEQSHVLTDKVRSGEIDTAVLALPYDVDGLHAFEFWEEDLFLVTFAGSPYAELDSIDSADLQDAELLLLKDGHCLRDHALAVCNRQSTDMRRSLAGTSMYTLTQMVAGHMGSTLVPQMALDQLLGGSSELRAVRLQEASPHRTIAFITRLNYAGVANIELLKKLFRQELKKSVNVSARSLAER